MAEEYDEWYVDYKEVLDCEARAVARLHLTGFGIDIGVGSGVFASRLGVQVGIDPALSLLRKAASRGVECVRAIGEQLPFRDRTFDFALMTITLCFLRDPDGVLEEARRVLRNEGMLGVCIIARDSRWGSLYLKKAQEGHVFYRHARFYTLAELEELLSSHGFRIAKCVATLSYGPDEVARIEEPSNTCNGRGFVCTKAKKIP